jgi:hypothetical protein
MPVKSCLTQTLPVAVSRTAMVVVDPVPEEVI